MWSQLFTRRAGSVEIGSSQAPAHDDEGGPSAIRLALLSPAPWRDQADGAHVDPQEVAQADVGGPSLPQDARDTAHIHDGSAPPHPDGTDGPATAERSEATAQSEGFAATEEAVGRDVVQELLQHPPETCRQTAAMWEGSRQAAVQTPISAAELFAHWIHRSQLHEVERRRLEDIYAQLDSQTLKTLAEAVREYRQNPGAVEAFVDTIREIELSIDAPS
ncbi:MAG: hypothetical protein ABR529_04120 [Actinomycetota bacterium]